MLKKTNWIVVTGEPRSGKTKLVEHLAFCGFRICPEVSRILLDNALSMHKVCNARTIEYEKVLFQEKLKAENRFDPEETVIWDRGPIDSVAFSKLYNKHLETAFISQLKYKYKYVFYLCNLPEFYPDYATVETKEKSKKAGDIIKNCYKQQGYKVIEIPVMDIKSRAEFVMRHAQIRVGEYNLK